MNDGETNQKRIEENGQVVLVSEYDASVKNGFKVIRGTPEKLLSQLVDENFAVDPNYADDFFLTYRTFMDKTEVMRFLLGTNFWNVQLSISQIFCLENKAFVTFDLTENYDFFQK